MVNEYTDETLSEDVAKILTGVNSITDYEYEVLKAIAPVLATQTDLRSALAASRSAYKRAHDSTKINNANFDALQSKFNKNIYRAGVDGTRFEIGPLTYGPEVQGVKIIEEKAISTVHGTRSSSDFIIDNGTGDADTQVTLMFSGADHLRKGLKPLVALFRLSPITSVDNDIIKGALYTDYTENNIAAPKVELLVNARLELELAMRQMRRKELLAILGEDEGTEITYEVYKEAVAKGYPLKGNLKEGWEDFQTATDVENLDPKSLQDQFYKDSNVALLDQNPTVNIDKPIDRTGYVPMAMVGMELKTHPELPESMIVNLFLKRIDVGNFLNEFLQYRDLENLPTPDAREAFWLNRAIDLYIDQNLPDRAVSFENLGDVSMFYQGDNVELEQFERSNDLKGFKISAGNSPDAMNKTVVTQMSYSIYNKFKFCRLIGRAYPTAQHMGTTSGTLSLAIQTTDDTEFERLHAYKSAADFFVRHIERFNRFNGWVVDTALTRLLNFDPKGYSNDAYNQDVIEPEEFKLKRAFYPSNVVSSTDDNLPGTKHLVIEFKETNPDFFDEFGFTVKKGGYQIDVLKDFFYAIYERAEDVRLNTNLEINEILGDEKGRFDLYAFDMFYGSGDDSSQIMFFNPDTLIASMLEPTTYEEGRYQTSAELSGRLLTELSGDERFSGIIDQAFNGWDVFWEEFKSLRLFFDTEIEISHALAKEMVDAYFVLPENSTSIVDNNVVQTEAYLELQLSRIAEPDARKELYKFLTTHREVGFTDFFIQKLFTAMVKRRTPPFTELYSLGGVVNAFNTMTLGLEARGEAFLEEEQLDPLSKRGSNEDRITVAADGRLGVNSGYTTAYPDFMFITYEQLFNLPDTEFEDEDNWLQYAPKYGELGIINFNIKTVGDNGFSDEAVTKMQNEIAVAKESPVPPSIFFYREDELEEMRTSLQTEYNEWFDKMKSMVLDLPYDVETATRDIHGRDTGATTIAIDDEETVKTIGDQLSTRIEKMVEKMEGKRPERLKELQQDIIAQQLNKLIESGKYTAEQVSDFSKDGNFTDEFFQDISWFTETAKDGVVVPFLMGRTMNSPVARYERITGVAGEGILRTIVFGNEQRSFRNEAFQDLVAETVRRSAATGFNSMTVTDAHAQEVHAGFLKVTQAMSDNRNDMIKAFPTMRLYIIEDTGPNLIVQDNFYGYHAIESIDITHDKYDASLAVIRIADPFHLLQGTAFSISEKGSLDNKLALRTAENFDATLLERLKLKQGRAIQIRGGYSSDPDHLDILFTGRIAEIQPGDVITVVAQGWKAELMGGQAEFELNSVADSSVKDLVVRTVRDSNPKGFGDVYSGDEYQAIRHVAAELGVQDEVIQSRLNSLGTHNGGSGAPGLSAGLFGFTILQNIDSGLDLRLKNVWVPDNDRARFKYFKDITEHGWQGSRWVVPLTPAWEILQNATKYVWGHICQVVPYDGEATLFFGRPEQLYYYTGSRRKIGKAIRHIKQRSKQEVSKDWGSVMEGFFNSPEFNEAHGTYTFDITLLNDPPSFFESEVQYRPTGSKFYSSPLTYPYGLPSYREHVHFGEKVNSQQAGYVFENFVNTVAPKYVTTESEERIHAIHKDALRRDVYSTSFEDIVAELGDRSLVSQMLFASFYGMSLGFLQRNVQSIEALMREMLSPISSTTQHINSIEPSVPTLANSLKSWYTVDEISAAIGASPIEEANLTFEEISVFIEALQDASSVAAFIEAFNTPSEGVVPVSTAIKSKPAYAGIRTDLKIALMKFWRLRKDLQDEGEFDKWYYSVGTAYEGQFSISPKQAVKQALSLYNGLLKEEAYYNSARGPRSELFNNGIFGEFSERLGNGVIAEEMTAADRVQLKNIIIRSLWKFRVFVHYLGRYVSKAKTSGDPKVIEAINSLQDNHSFDPKLLHNMKVFRDYHYITDTKDILANDIAATTREMYNSVVVRYPAELETSNNVWWIPDFIENRLQGNSPEVQVSAETSWTSWPSSSDGHIGIQFDDTISLEDKKIMVHTDLNVTRKEQAAMVATNVLAGAMRPMYRNKLTILGRNIKPWDYIYLNDKYTDMQGMLDVERVVHHYSASEGWVTNIVPHAACEANPGNRSIQAAVFASRMDRMLDTADYAFNALLILSFVPTGGASIAAAGALRSAVSASSKSGVKKLTSSIQSASVTAAVQQLKRHLFSDSKKFLKNYIITEGLAYGGNFFSNLGQANMRAGKDNLPVLFSPIMFKGVPLEAGLHGSELTYWSLGSKVHWSRKHFSDGISDLFDSIADIGNPKVSDLQAQIESLKNTQSLGE